MKISSITQYKYMAQPVRLKQKAVNINFTNKQKTPLTEDDYMNAQEYCQKRCEVLKNQSSLNEDTRKYSLTYNFDLEKLNGLQYGIDLFSPHNGYDGMTMEEIAFALGDISILLNRGCNNLCSHCYINALPASRLKGATSFTYEDFEKLLDGISELKSRVEKNGINLKFPIIASLFDDSDCIDIEIKDKNGRKYDVIDCFELISRYPNLESKGLFDTSGWNPDSKIRQQRADKLVNYIQSIYKNKNIKNKPVKNLMISINPFHSLYQKSIDLSEKNPKEAKNCRDLYVKRMANTLFKFAPLLDIKGFALNLNITALNSDSRYNCGVVDKLIDEIMSELDKLCDERQIPSKLKEHILDKYNAKIIKILTRTNFGYRPIQPYGRAKNIMPKDLPSMSSSKQRQIGALIMSEKLNSLEKAINPNGEVRAVIKGLSFSTDIHLNLSQSDKQCSALGEESEVKFSPKYPSKNVSDVSYL